MPLKTHVDEEPSINMTPMVDVVFQLILFFLLGTKFTEMERKIGLEIPQVTETKSLTAAPDRQVVNIYRDGGLTLDGAPVTLDDLVPQLASRRSQYGDLEVLVRGDAKGQFQRVAEVLTACKRAGVQELGIAVLPIPPEK